MVLYPSGPEAATRFLKFVNASPTPFHAVHNAAIRLEKAGFLKVGPFFNVVSFDWIFCRFERKMNGRRRCNLGGNIISPGQIFAMLHTESSHDYRNQAALVAFTLPQNWKQGTGLSIVATHVDSPNLRVCPLAYAMITVQRSCLDSTCFQTHEIVISSCWRRNIRRRNMALLVRSRS